MTLFFLLRPYHWFQLHSTDPYKKKRFEGPIKGPYKRKKALESLKKTLFNKFYDIIETPEIEADIPAIVEDAAAYVAKDYSLEIAFLDDLIRIAKENKQKKDAQTALINAITAEIRQELIRIDWEKAETKRLEILRIKEEERIRAEARRRKDDEDLMVLFAKGII